jgi:hypothetical protein
MNWFEDLDIDRQDLTVLADAYSGYAKVLASAEKNRELLPLIASSRLLGAVYRALVDPRAAREEFRDAARLYLNLGIPYCSLLAVCGEDSEVLTQYWRIGQEAREQGGGDTDLLGSLVASCWLSANPNYRERYRGVLSKVLSQTREQSAITVGRLRLPLRLYLATVEEISHFDRQLNTPNSGQFRHTIAWLERAAEPVAQAMKDRFHWRRLHSGVLPIEPEIVGTCVGIIRIWNQRDQGHDLASLIREADVSPLAIIPIEVASQLINPDHGDVGQPKQKELMR